MEQLTPEQKEYIVSKLMKTQEGRTTVAQTMIEPIKVGRDYVGIGRKLLLVDQLPPGAPAWYDKDIDIPAIVMSQRGSVPRTQDEGDRVEVEVYAIASNPRIPILETAIRRFNILDRTQIKARADLAEQEDYQVFAALTAAATGIGANTAQTSTSGMDRKLLNKMFAQVEQWDAPVGSLIAHPSQYKDLRAWTTTEFDQVTQREVIKTGLMGNLWGADVYRSKMITSGTAFCVADLEFLGVMPVRIDLDVLDAPEPKDLELGFVFYEYIGISIVQVTSVGYASSITGDVGGS